MVIGESKNQSETGSTQKPYLPRILKHLVEHGPDTINGTNSGIRGDYKNTHENFKKAEKLGMISATDSDGHGYQKYWLTGRGASFALGLGADPEKLRMWAKKLGLDSDLVEFESDLAKEVGPDRFGKIMAAFYQREKPFAGSDSFAKRWLAPDLRGLIPVQDDDLAVFFKVVRRYPELVKVLLERVDDLRRQLGSVRQENRKDLA